MKKLLILALACAVAVAATTQAAQDPNKKKSAPTKTVAKSKVTNTHTANTHVQNNHIQTHNNVHVNNNNVHVNNNKTTFHQTNKTVNNNKTVNKVQVNNKVTNLHKANAANWSKIHQQHQNFHATGNNKIAGAKFNAKFHIAGANNWHGQKYMAFKNYHPMWHDHFWWHDHYHNVLLIGGGWYYWNSGYWYPAWGYDDSAAYYPYDGPIYTGSNPTPADQVIADVQTSLQQQGYYQGEVDGLLGPQTRAALADYQQAQGLEMTAAIDEPTLDSLGMS